MLGKNSLALIFLQMYAKHVQVYTICHTVILQPLDKLTQQMQRLNLERNVSNIFFFQPYFIMCNFKTWTVHFLNYSFYIYAKINKIVYGHTYRWFAN